MNRSATNIPSACKTANIAQNDAMILPHDANPGRMGFSERTREGTSDKDKQKAADRYYGGAFASALAGESTLTCWRSIRFFRLQLSSRLEERGQDVEKQLEQIHHQAASLPRLFLASIPNRIFGTHRLCRIRGKDLRCRRCCPQSAASPRFPRQSRKVGVLVPSAQPEPSRVGSGTV